MRVALTHTTRLDYSADVVEAVMDTRIGPRSDAHQRWDRFDMRVAPSAAVRAYSDGFGNTAHLITISRAHSFVEIISSGRVHTLLQDPFALPSAPPRPLDPSDLADYLNPSLLVPRHPGLEEMAAPFRPPTPARTFDAVREMSHQVYERFTYRKDVTTVATTVAEVLEGQTGVCQDFAHVLIGLCRALDVPARYVSGYIVQRTVSQAQVQSGAAGSQSQSMSWPDPRAPGRGAGASHAWIEAYTPTHGWRGFDPTNDLVASEFHIKMAIGRDYADVPPTRGTFRGVADERLSVDVRTESLD